MEQAYEDLKEFHKKFEMDEVETPSLLPQDLMEFRVNFLAEEFDEIREAYVAGDLAGVADGLVDLCYVAIGTAELMGLPFAQLWDEVHKANMSKKRAEPDGSDSKRFSKFDIVKPQGWVPPQIEAILARADKYDRG